MHAAAELSDDVCRRFVKETSLVECTFLEASDVADLKVRYFLASREIPFAGHPTIATVASLLHRGLVAGIKPTLETGAGLVPIEIARSGEGPPEISMLQVAPEFGAVVARDVVARVGGLQASDIIAQPQVVSTGLPFCITVLKDHDALSRVELNVGALAGMVAILGHDGTDMMEPFWVTLEGATRAGNTFSRLLLAPPSPVEDAFTGSASGAMAAYLWKYGLIDRPDFTAEQGHWLGRPGQARIEVMGHATPSPGCGWPGRGMC